MSLYPYVMKKTTRYTDTHFGAEVQYCKMSDGHTAYPAAKVSFAINFERLTSAIPEATAPLL